ncbi:MAG: AraC family transcriptional regulator [Phycisphaeraceae bacterium]
MIRHQTRLRIRTHEPVKQAGLFARPVTVRADVASHDHDFLEIVLVFAGRGVHRTLYGHKTLRPGDVLVIGPRQWHAYEQCGGLKVWNCGIGERLLKDELAWTAEDATLRWLLWPVPSSPQSPDEGRGIIEGRFGGRALPKALIALRELADAANQPERLGRLLIFLAAVSDVLHPGGDRQRACPPVHPAVRRVMEAMRHDLAADWSLDQMARISRVNRFYLVRLFRRHTGQSPVAMLLKWRCERAAGLLIQTDHPVAHIGMRVGWPDPNYFGRRFRRHFGTPPSAFRADHRNT